MNGNLNFSLTVECCKGDNPNTTFYW